MGKGTGKGCCMVRVCYRCHRPLGEIEPLEDTREVKKGICEDCLKMETIEVQRALKLLRDAGRIKNGLD